MSIAYNQSQAEKYGWDPSWFGCEDFNEELLDSIKEFQRKHGLVPDGMCGPGTFRRLWTEREEEQELHRIEILEENDKKYIVYNTEHFEIFWPKVVLWNQENGQEASKGHFSSYAGERPRKPRFFVNHWDVCLSSSSCFRVLEKRGISIHFGIDNDGTIYQWLDMQHAAWHAGGKTWNHASLGVEIANAYYPKYQKWYVKHGFGKRPIISGQVIHGKPMEDYTGFYPAQLDALAALWEAVSFACDIPLELPKTKNAVDQECSDGYFKGFCNHYHLTRRKIDCAGLGDEIILGKAKELRRKRLKQ